MHTMSTQFWHKDRVWQLSDQLVDNIHPKGFSGRATLHELRGGRHHRKERGELLSHLGMVDGNDPHSLP
jgi:hypothetical protein